MRWAVAALVLAASTAHAGKYYTLGEYATVGPIGTASISPAVTSGLLLAGGLEATYGHHLGGNSDAALGGFLQARYVGEGAFEVAAGIQPTFAIVGVELGGAYRTESSRAPGHARLHFAPFISALGVAALSVRCQVPLSGDTRTGIEVGLGLTIKLAFHKERDKGGWQTMPKF